MRTVLIKAEIVEERDGALRARLDDGFGSIHVILHESKAIPFERLDNGPDIKKAAHKRQQRQRA